MTSETEAKSPFEFAISKEQKEKISDILSEVSKLTNLEQWCLYLRLPSCPVSDERIKSPTASLSSSSLSAQRTSTTLHWLQSHYQEDFKLCVPKQELYNQYRTFCDTNGLRPVATSDFGKIVRTAFPNVHDRRLGQRGKSKYCYGGLKQKSTSEEAEALLEEDQLLVDPVEELELLSSQLVCEWASSLLGKQQFPSLKSLAQYLVCSGASCGKMAALFNMLYDSWGSSSSPLDRKNSYSQLPDRQALVQRKLLQKEVLKEHKNLLKRQEQNQQNVLSGQASSMTRLAVLSPSVNQPSTLHVLNFTGSTIPSLSSVPAIPSIPLMPNLVLGQESVGVSTTPILPDFGGGSTTSSSSSCRPSPSPMKKTGNNNSLVGELKPDIGSLVVQTLPVTSQREKMKASKLVSSRSLEDGSQRQPKRNYDTLHSSSQGRDTKRRRCITSLGVKELQEQRAAGAKGEGCSISGKPVQLRPVSCPVFHNNLDNLDCSMENEDLNSSGACNTPLSRSETEVTSNSVKVSSASDVSSGTDSVSSCFHFVRKPKVISVKNTDRPDTSEPLYANVDNLGDSCSTLDSPVKNSHHILNSILSLSDSHLSHRVNTAEKQMINATQSLNRLNPDLFSNQSPTSAFDKRDKDSSVDSELHEVHSLDTATLLPRQPNRSAFVPVLNGKGNSDSRLDIASQLGHISSDDASSRSAIKHSDSPGVSSCDSRLSDQALGSTAALCEKARLSQDSIQHDVDNFESTSSSMSKSSTFSSTDAGEYCISTKTSSSTSSLEISVTPTKLSGSEAGHSSAAHTPCMTSPVLCQPRRMSAKSPVTPPKRQSKSRFTPIRPKLGACCNVSPQKKDMRPVSTILREQRARSAQELLVNLASSYQVGIPVQVPHEVLVMASPDKTNQSASGEVVSIQDVSQPQSLTPCRNNSKDNITVIVKSTAVSNTTVPTLVTPLISSQKMISPTPCQPVTSSLVSQNIQVTSTASGPSTSPSMRSFTKTQPPVPSQTTRNVPHVEPQVVVADAEGTMYSLEREAINPPQNTPGRQMLLPANNSSNNMPLSAIPPKQKVIKVSDIQGHLIGPDASGQTYLLVPNSVSAPLASSVVSSSKSPLSSSASTASCTWPTQSGQPIPSRSIGPLPVPSSSALLSELSHLASGSKQDKTKLCIQHDSANSAFQKCEPNKTNLAMASNQTVMLPGGQTLQRNSTIVSSVAAAYSHTISAVQPDKNQGKEPGREPYEGPDHSDLTDVSIRKRKASKGQDEKISENKRQNTKSSTENVLLDLEDSACSPIKEEVKTDVAGWDSNDKDSSVVSTRGEGREASDTDTLLNMINKSRSMTVKETVMAMNSLRARMHGSTPAASPDKSYQRNSSLISPLESKISESRCVTEETSTMPHAKLPHSRREASGDSLVDKGKVTKMASHVIRRNTSLNLESLESDALLDTELCLDHHLVEDMKSGQGTGLDNKTSVAVAVKTQSSSTKHRKRGDGNAAVTISPKALQSYMILSEKGQSARDRSSSKEFPHKMKLCSVKQEQKDIGNESKEDLVTRSDQQQLPSVVPRRSISCVKEILENSSKEINALANWTASQSPREKLNYSEVDAFDALLSKMRSKTLPGATGLGSHSLCLGDSEIPGDIVDFVTESMTSRKLPDRGATYPSSSSLGMENPTGTASLQALSTSNNLCEGRSVSVPITTPDFCEMGQRQLTSSSSESSTLTPSDSLSQVSTRPSSVDTSALKEDAVPKNVFLSPVGPAKLARRSSVEKCTSQGHADKLGMRCPSEATFSSTSIPAPVKEKNVHVVNQKLQSIERRRTRTPVDRALSYSHDQHQNQQPGMSLQFAEKYRQEETSVARKSPINRSQTKTPIDKFFMRQQSNDLQPPAFNLPSAKSSSASSSTVVVKEEAASVLTPVASDSGCSQDSVSITPSSEHSQGGASGGANQTHTPSSDFGYSSVSPSPVMMSSAGYGGECGRNLSPATIFMPLRSDSVLSVSNNHSIMRSDSPSSSAQNAQAVLDRLSEFLNHIQNEPMGTLSNPDDPFPPKRNSDPKECLSESSSELPDIPSILKSLNSKPSSLVSSGDGKEKSELMMTSSSDTKSLMKLISSSLQSIPTPPVSPTSASPPAVTSSSTSSITPPFPPSIPVFLSSHHHPDSSSSPPSLVSDFLLPISSSCMSSVGHDAAHQLSPSPHFRSRDLPSPALVARGYTPSPQIPTRPPSSPHPFSSPHPSPPFTPCSLRSLPSPRCLTPSSHKSLISPRSVTPSSDPTQAPNRFMPIQSSGVLPISLAPSHTYIQPIKPVVALASASTNNPHPSIPRAVNTVSKGFSSMSSRKGTSLKSSQGALLPHAPPNPLSPPQTGLQSKSPAQEPGCCSNTVRVSEHKPLSESSTVVLSLPEAIGSFSPNPNTSSLELPWAGSELLHRVDSSQPRSFDQNRAASLFKGASDIQGRKSDKLPQQSQRRGRAGTLQDPPQQPNDPFSGHHRTPYPNPDIVVPFHHSPQTPISQNSKLKLKHNAQIHHPPPSTTPRQLSSKPTRHSSCDGAPPPKVNSSSLSSSSSSSSPLVKLFIPSSHSLSLSSSKSPSVCSFVPVVDNSISHHHRFPPPTSSSRPTPQAARPDTRGRRVDKTARSFSAIPSRPDSGLPTSAQHRWLRQSRNSVQGVYSAGGQDELQVTLDVLKKMDSHYFQCDEDTL